MKRFLLLAGLALAVSPLWSQKGLKLGAFVLPQYTTLLNADDSELDEDLYAREALWGMGGGVSLGYHFNDYIGLRLSAFYNQQGGAYSAQRDVLNRTTYVNRLEYLKLPLMLYINSNPVSRKVQFVFAGGAQLDLLSRAFAYNDNPAYEAPLPDNILSVPSETEKYQRSLFSLTGLSGIDIQLPPDNLVLNLHFRADYQLSDAEDKDVRYRFLDNAVVRSAPYWRDFRGASRLAETYGLTAGLLIGVTYTLGGGASAE